MDAATFATFSLNGSSALYTNRTACVDALVASRTSRASASPPAPPSRWQVCGAARTPTSWQWSTTASTSRSVSVANRFTATTGVMPSVWSIFRWASRFAKPVRRAFRSSRVRSFFFTPPWCLSARTLTTRTAASGRSPLCRHTRSTNFSPPRSEPNPASVRRDDVPQLAVVHVEAPREQDAGRIQVERVPVEEVRVHDRRDQVVRGADRVDVSREVEVDLLHGEDLGLAAARGPSFRPEDGPERRLSDRDDRPRADAVQRLAQPHRRPCPPFPLAARRRAGRRHDAPPP